VSSSMLLRRARSCCGGVDKRERLGTNPGPSSSTRSPASRWATLSSMPGRSCQTVGSRVLRMVPAQGHRRGAVTPRGVDLSNRAGRRRPTTRRCLEGKPTCRGRPPRPAQRRTRHNNGRRRERQSLTWRRARLHGRARHRPRPRRHEPVEPSLAIQKSIDNRLLAGRHSGRCIRDERVSLRPDWSPNRARRPLPLDLN